MIKTFGNQTTEDIYHGISSREARKCPRSLRKKAERLLDQLNAITQIETLRIPPGNHLEKLRGNLSEFWSIRINQQWRIIFKWEKGTALEVEIIDYH